MVRSVYIASIEKLAGKTLVLLSVASKARSAGMKVGYFKPIGLGSSLDPEGNLIDEDVETMSRILDLKDPHDVICPITLGRDEFLEAFASAKPEELIEKIRASWNSLSEGKDLMLIEGPDDLSTGSFLGLHVPRVAAQLGSKVVLVAHAASDWLVDDVLQARDYCEQNRSQVAGVLLNRVPGEKMDRMRRVVTPYLEGRGIRVLGSIPEDKALGALTVAEICRAIDGKVLAGEEGMGKTIRNYLVGAMTMESAMKYFRRTADELVITGGDRTDIILAAMEAGAAGLVLTGNLYPSIKILPRADDMSIPLILVPHDTLTTLNLVQRTIGKIRDERRIEIARKLFEKNVDWKTIVG